VIVSNGIVHVAGNTFPVSDCPTNTCVVSNRVVTFAENEMVILLIKLIPLVMVVKRNTADVLG
jgi:hypothetical protein